MRRFSVRHLLFLTALAAIACAVARLLEYELVLTTLATFAIFAPCVCFSIATMVAATKRPLRKVLRYSLLAIAFSTIIAIGVFVYGLGVVPPLIFLMFVGWTPQIILLEICSAYRTVLAGTAF